MRKMGQVKKSGSGLPLISIITPVFNAEKELERSIDEVQCQTYANKEHIIIDGGSRDNTVELLERNNNKIDYWISEADGGIYDAMNKGIAEARGEWIYFLGADDVFYRHDTLLFVMQRPDITDDVALVLGNIVYPDGRIFRSSFNKTIFFKNTVHHQSAFYRRSVFGGFRYSQSASSCLKDNFSISGDYQLNLLLFMRNVKYVYINEIISRCGRGVSMEGRFAGYLEEIIIRHLYLNFFQALFFDIMTLLRYGWKKIGFRNYHKL
jgi:putative colanic acid biosynthesis glycosyltransferase